MTVDLSDPQIQKITYQCLLRIQSVYDSLKSAERRAVDFLMTDPEFLAKNSIVEVAVRAGCSEATLVRLSYRMGFGSYSDLKAAVLKEDATENLECLYEGIEEHDDAPTVMGKVMRSSIQAIEDTVSLIDPQAYQRAVDAILAAGRLQFAGIGDAGVVAMSGYYKIFRLGMNVYFSQDDDLAARKGRRAGGGQPFRQDKNDAQHAALRKRARCNGDRCDEQPVFTDRQAGGYSAFHGGIRGKYDRREYGEANPLVLPFRESVHQCAGAHRRRAAAAA